MNDLLDAFSQRSVSTDEHMEVFVITQDLGKSEYKTIDSLLATQAADVPDEGRAFMVWSTDSEGSKVEKMLMGDENLVAITSQTIF